MTKPKRHIPGQVAFITRRTTHRQFFLRPGKDTRELVGYMYGKYVVDCAQEPYAACQMSNHFHSLQGDPDVKRSDFMQRFFSQVTRKRNLELNRRENLWVVGPPGDTALVDLEGIVDKLLYTWLQPVAAGCVDTVEEWTGFMILPKHWGKPMRFPRQETCGKSMPEWVEFTPGPPPGFEHLPLDEVIAFFEDLIEKEETRYRKKREFEPLGIEYCEAVHPFYTPSTKAPMRTLNPKFSGKDKRLLAAAIRRQLRFQAEHRNLLNRFRDGERDVVFPSGTIQMKHLAGVDTEAVPRGDPHLPHLDWTTDLTEQWDQFLERHYTKRSA